MTQRNAYRDKVAIVTGGASGIGAALAREIASSGALLVLADRQPELAESVAATIRERGGSAVAMELDVRDFGAVQHVVNQTLARFGRVDYFFNNAGIISSGEAAAYEVDDWSDVFDVNIRGVAFGIQAVYPVMIRQRWGHIINTASVAGLLTTPGLVAYSTSKHAVVGLSKALRVEGKHYGVRVSALCPGVISTPMLTGGKYGRTTNAPPSDEERLKVWGQFRPLDVAVFAKRAAPAIARNEAIVIVPSWWKVLWAIDRISPAIGEAIMTAMFERVRPEMQPSESKAANAVNTTPSAPNNVSL